MDTPLLLNSIRGQRPRRGPIGNVPAVVLLSVISLLLSIGGSSLTAQSLPSADASKEIVTVGVFGGIAWNFMRAAFSVDTDGEITDRSDCGRFERGNGMSPLLGVVADLPVNSLLRIGFDYDVSRRTSQMQFACVDPATTRLPDGTVVPAITEHVADVSITSLVATPRIIFTPFQSLPLLASIGPSLSFNLSSSYQAREEIRTPANAEFVSGGQVREYGSGAFVEGGSVGLGLSVSISARLPMGGNWLLEPRVGALFALGDDYASVGLRSDRYIATLGVLRRFDGQSSPSVRPPIVVAPPPAPIDERLEANLRVVSRSSAEVPLFSDTVVMQRRLGLRTQLHPLLTYIFFNSGDSTLPVRYHRRTRGETEEFGEQALRKLSTIEIYHNVLDIIGLRLTRNPESRIVITGTQPDAPGVAGLRLADRRAVAVRRYLSDSWGISAERMRIETRVNPAAISNPETEEGSAENRRVEISSEDFRITAPIVFTDTVVQLDYPAVVLRPEAVATAGIASWQINVDGRMVAHGEAGGDGTTGSVRLDSEIVRNSGELISAGADPNELHVELEVRDRRGEVVRRKQSIPVRRVNTESIVRYGTGSYSLILFDFNSAVLRSEHLRTIDLVNERTDPRAGARVYGFTDRLGPDDLNMQLSDRRARAVAQAVHAHIEEVVGLGETKILYDNALPEGRLYSRSVTIETRLLESP